MLVYTQRWIMASQFLELYPPPRKKVSSSAARKFRGKVFCSKIWKISGQNGVISFPAEFLSHRSHLLDFREQQAILPDKFDHARSIANCDTIPDQTVETFLVCDHFWFEVRASPKRKIRYIPDLVR